MIKYENIPHGSDLRVRAYGRDLGELFENMAEGMFSLNYDTAKAGSADSRDIVLEGEDAEELLINMLKELLYAINAGEFIFKKVELKGKPANGGVAVARGEKFAQERLERLHEVKAVTYHGVQIVKKDGLYQVSVVYDV